MSLNDLITLNMNLFRKKYFKKSIKLEKGRKYTNVMYENLECSLNAIMSG